MRVVSAGIYTTISLRATILKILKKINDFETRFRTNSGNYNATALKLAEELRPSVLAFVHIRQHEYLLRVTVSVL